MLNEDSDLSPWAHPKAQKWFTTLLERSGFVNQVEDTVQLDEDHFELAHGRVLLALLIMLGRPGIWPEDKKRVLQRAASRINRLTNNATKTETNEPGKKKKAPLTLEQHQRKSAAAGAIKDELEILRRRAGVSNRKSNVPQPSTWKGFWS